MGSKRVGVVRGLRFPARDPRRLSERQADSRADEPRSWSGPTLAKDQKKLEPVNWADWAAMWVGHAKQVE